MDFQCNLNVSANNPYHVTGPTKFPTPTKSPTSVAPVTSTPTIATTEGKHAIEHVLLLNFGLFSHT